MPPHADRNLADRPLTREERDLLSWMLRHGNRDAARFLPQVDRARVVALCPCGCASFDVSVDGLRAQGGLAMRVLADFVGGDAANPYGAFVFAQGETLSGLEVYGMANDAPRVLPRPADLRPMTPRQPA